MKALDTPNAMNASQAVPRPPTPAPISSRLQSEASTRLRVAVVDPDQSVQALVRKALATHANELLIEYLRSAEQALHHLPLAPPALVLMEIGMPDLCGIECTKRLVARRPDLHIVMFTGRADPETILLSLAAGARGYLLKPSTSAHLMLAVRRLPVFCSQTRGVVRDLFRRLSVLPGLGGLSPRHQKIMFCVAKGMGLKDVSLTLGLGYATVRTHLAEIYKRLGVHELSEVRRKFLYAAEKWLPNG